jgi:ABC-type phosphate transport system substrate-binding protein
MKALFGRAALVAAAFAGLSIVAGDASAIDCRELARPVFVTGSTAARPLLAEVGRILAGSSPASTIVYKGHGSCDGVHAIIDAARISGVGTAGLTYWDAAGGEHLCDIEPTGLGGVLADVGISDVFANTCFPLPGGLPTNVNDFLGPIQTMAFVVPQLSQEQAISAEAAYYVFGFGKDSGVLPWTNETLIFHRDQLSGTQRLVATAIGVPPYLWKGVTANSSEEVKTLLTASPVPAQAIGILGADVVAASTGALRVLAYQASGQSCAYLPDRLPTSKEKGNVRDGRYAIWGPLHLFARINSSGYPVSSLAGEVIGYLTGTRKAPTGLDLVALEARHHFVPSCAMRVMRNLEMGPLIPTSPVGACGCSYDKAANGSTDCTPCARHADCPTSAPVCSYGYCERQ